MIYTTRWLMEVLNYDMKTAWAGVKIVRELVAMGVDLDAYTLEASPGALLPCVRASSVAKRLARNKVEEAVYA